MISVQIRVLFREFLFRTLDLEILAKRGDLTQMLGQFAAVLGGLSVLHGLEPIFSNPAKFTPEEFTLLVWRNSHSLIASTMLVTGFFGVLSWESTFPDRRDVMVLEPLPLRYRTMFVAKLAAMSTAMLLTIGALNFFSGATWPWHFAAGPGVGYAFRSLGSHWITIFMAGSFLFFAVVAIHGIAGQLPRRYYLRVSAALQAGLFFALLVGYFLEPSWARPDAIAAPEHAGLLDWMPTYWFAGLFHALNGSGRGIEEIGHLARRAMAAWVIACVGASLMLLLSYFRTLRRIVEEPDIAPARSGSRWPTISVGTPLHTAMAYFSVRTLIRSRQHRVIYAFYIGIGLALVWLYMEATIMRGYAIDSVRIPATASLVLLCMSLVGVRSVFALPIDLRANWIFKVLPVPDACGCYSAVRRSLLILAVAPVLVLAAIAFLWNWPTWVALAHLAVLAFTGSILADVLLRNFPKLPFTCSFLAGKLGGHEIFMRGFFGLLGIALAGMFEARQLAEGPRTILLVVGLGIAAALVRWLARVREPEDRTLKFEEQPEAHFVPLNLHRDGGPVMVPWASRNLNTESRKGTIGSWLG